jgi:hypothetical protein
MRPDTLCAIEWGHDTAATSKTQAKKPRSLDLFVRLLAAPSS